MRRMVLISILLLLLGAGCSEQLDLSTLPEEPALSPAKEPEAAESLSEGEG